MAARTFVGFGFGAIQAGLFLDEAFRSRRFSRLVVAEVVPEVVAALREAEGAYTVNVATPDALERRVVHGVTALNPRDPADRATLVEAVAEAGEIATALPSVAAFEDATPGGVAGVLADGLRRKQESGGPRAIVYTAENHNQAAELLTAALRTRGAPLDRVACLNTVIGKMSGIVTDAAAIRDQGLAPYVPGAARAFLVEAFNRIQITKVPWPDFFRGISVFEERADLLPFEEAKLYGHNAVHALLGYHLWRRGARTMAEAAAHPDLLRTAREAFLEEAGAALCRKHAGCNRLFTADAWRAYADDLLTRMCNPHLRDAVDRVTRDPRRKLGWNDRLVGTMRLVSGQGLVPRHFAMAARLAADMLAAEDARPLAARLRDVWAAESPAPEEAAHVLQLIEEAQHEN